MLWISGTNGHTRYVGLTDLELNKSSMKDTFRGLGYNSVM